MKRFRYFESSYSLNNTAEARGKGVNMPAIQTFRVLLSLRSHLVRKSHTSIMFACHSYSFLFKEHLESIFHYVLLNLCKY